MKLLPIIALAALSLFGCAMDNDGEGGGYIYGLRPAKPSADDVMHEMNFVNNRVSGAINGLRAGDAQERIIISVPFPIDGLCNQCDDLSALADNSGQIDLLDKDGYPFCRLWVERDGKVAATDCK